MRISINTLIFGIIAFSILPHIQNTIQIKYYNINGKIEIQPYIGNPPKETYFLINLSTQYTWLTPWNYDKEKSDSSIYLSDQNIVVNHITCKAQQLSDTFFDESKQNPFRFYFYWFEENPEGAVDTLSLTFIFDSPKLSIVEQMKKQGVIAREMFSFIPLNEEEGILSFGGYPEEKILNLSKLSMKVNPYHEKWGIDITGASIDGHVYTSSDYAFFNSIDNDIQVPKAFMDFLHKYFLNNLIANKICKLNQNDIYQCERDKLDSIKQFPKLYLIIEGKKLLLDRDILFSHHRPLCNLRIREHLHSNQWEIGTSFLHYFISVFDYENRTITLYYQNKDKDNSVLYILIGLILLLLSYIIYLTIFIALYQYIP